MSIGAMTAEQIQQQFVNYLLSLQNAPVTDYNVGSVIRLLESPQAQALEGLYEQNIIQRQETIQTMMYQMLQFPPRPAINAYVQVTFTNSNTTAQTFNAGTLLTIPNSTLQYSVQATFTVPAASGGTNGTATATIVCTTPGTIGNAPANSITQLVSPVSGVSVTNNQAVITGKDAETADERAARFYAHMARIHRGDKEALEAGALTSNITDASGYITEQVVKAVAIDGTFVTNPTTAPVLIAVTPGTLTNLAAGNYTVGYTFTNANGETLMSPTSTVTLTAGQEIQVDAITLETGATGINYYMSTAVGSSTLAYDANGTGAQVDLTALPASGASSPPTINTAYLNTAGYATIWGYNGTGTMSSTLVTQTQNIINGYTDAQGVPQTGYKAAGVIATFQDATTYPVTLTIGLYPAPGYTVSMIMGSVTIAVQGVFDALDIGETLRINDLVAAIRNVPGVLNVSVTPSSDLSGVNGQIYTLNGTPAYMDLSA